jgi:hypothetical protein
MVVQRAMLTLSRWLAELVPLVPEPARLHYGCLILFSLHMYIRNIACYDFLYVCVYNEIYHVLKYNYLFKRSIFRSAENKGLY